METVNYERAGVAILIYDKIVFEKKVIRHKLNIL